MRNTSGELRRFIWSLAIMAATLVAVDVLFGFVADVFFLRLPLRDKAPSTICHRHCDSTDVVVIGSSRCHHHYVSTILKDSLCNYFGEELSLYNYGLDGVYVNSSLCAIESMLCRHSPRMVILDANSHEFDVAYRNTVATASPLYRRDGVVRRYIDCSQPGNRIRMLSSLYRYRGAVTLRMVETVMSHPDTLLGFGPLANVMDSSMTYPPGPTTGEFVADSVTTANFRRVASLCAEKGVLLVVVDSPRYRPADNSEYVGRLCHECGVPFIDFYDSEIFNRRPELFHEPAHLNAHGAELFSEKLSRVICDQLSEKRVNS